MKKITKKYINKLILGREIQEEVDVIAPELVDTKNVNMFYYSEQSFIIDGEDIYKGKIIFYPEKYYVGTRISVLEAIQIAAKYDRGTNCSTYDYCLCLNEKNPNATLCKTDTGVLYEMDENSITLEEYINNKNNQKKRIKTKKY